MCVVWDGLWLNGLIWIFVVVWLWVCIVLVVDLGVVDDVVLFFDVEWLLFYLGWVCSFVDLCVLDLIEVLKVCIGWDG